MKTMNRNRHGVKDADRLWRTVNGAHFVQWRSWPTDDEVKAYRAAGVRCCRFGAELFVHHADQDAARAVDLFTRKEASA